MATNLCKSKSQKSIKKKAVEVSDAEAASAMYCWYWCHANWSRVDHPVTAAYAASAALRLRDPSGMYNAHLTSSLQQVQHAHAKSCCRGLISREISRPNTKGHLIRSNQLTRLAMFDRPPVVDHGLSPSPNSHSSAMAMLSDLDVFLSEDLQSSGSASTTTGRCSPARKSSFSSLANSKSSSRTLLAVLGEVCDRCSAAISPFLSSVQLGHISCLRPLVRSGALDLGSDCTASGVTAIHIASKRGDLEALKMLLEYDPTAVDLRDERGACGSHIAAYQGEAECLTALVRVGGCGQRTYDGATPAHFAAAGGHLEALKVLEKANMEANATTKSGATPVYFAAQEGHTDCVQWLVETAGADPRIASSDGMAPLHAAAQTGRLNAMTWLVRKADCDLLCRTSDGATPVHFAAAKGHVHILTWMLYQKLCTGLEEDDYGDTPVHDAAEQGQLESLQVFASHRVRMFPTDSEGLTPLDLAEQHGHTACVRFLKNMSSQSSVSQIDDDGASSSGTDSHSVNTLDNDLIAGADSFAGRPADAKDRKQKRSKWSLARGIKRKLSRDHSS